MASFEKRGELQWRAKVRRLGQPEISKTFETKSDAMHWAREVERKIKRGEIDDLDPTTQKITVAQAVASYRELVLPSLAREGKGTGDVHLRRIEKRFGAIFISALRSPGINEWAQELVKLGLGGQTIIHHLNTFSGLIRHAQTVLGVHIPSGNPLKLVKRPAPSHSRERVLLPGELDLLLEAARVPSKTSDQPVGSMLEPIIILALETSMRQGELLALRWNWIDLTQGVVTLPANSTKNGDSRTVALSQKARQVLAGVKALPQNINGRVFGSWANADSFKKQWGRLLKRAQGIYAKRCADTNTKADPRVLADLRFHDLRHTATTELFSKGFNPFEVASMTGHKSMQMLRRYTHVDAAKLAQKLG